MRRRLLRFGFLGMTNFVPTDEIFNLLREIVCDVDCECYESYIPKNTRAEGLWKFIWGDVEDFARFRISRQDLASYNVCMVFQVRDIFGDLFKKGY
jgi:CRP-like cAMP-binding protein